MATVFSALPVVDLSLLSIKPVSEDELVHLSGELDRVFSTTGFAYLVNTPLSLSHEEIFELGREFFELPEEEKMKLAKTTFRPSNTNTYRGYFPPQLGQTDNLKEGFEIGPRETQGNHIPKSGSGRAILDMTEPNIWPSTSVYPSKSRTKLEQFHTELQQLSIQLLSLLAHALGEPEGSFAGWLDNSISTLRLLHYPPQPPSERTPIVGEQAVKLCCTPHTDSGILTLLHQDATGGLEVRNASGHWIPAPYIPGSIVVNIGDLMARVSGGRYVATLHRVRSSSASGEGAAMGRLSVPFFFEPGEDCVVKSVRGDDEGVRYGDHVRAKMRTWVEFQDVVGEAEDIILKGQREGREIEVAS